VAVVIGTSAVLATGSLLDLWRGSEAAPLVRWCVSVVGAFVALLTLAAFVWVSLGRDDAYRLRIRTGRAAISGIPCLFVFVSPLFGFLADTLGTFAGLLLGLLAFLISRFFGL
jgi:hypothetical protein